MQLALPSLLQVRRKLTWTRRITRRERSPGVIGFDMTGLKSPSPSLDGSLTSPASATMSAPFFLELTMQSNENLHQEYTLFGGDVFTNVYDGEKTIQMPASLKILGFILPSQSVTRTTFSGVRFCGICLRSCASQTAMRSSSPGPRAQARRASSTKSVLGSTGRCNRSHSRTDSSSLS